MHKKLLKNLFKKGKPCSFANQETSGRYWINFTNTGYLPSYNEIVSALLMYQGIAVSICNFDDKVIAWASDDYIRELLNNKLIIFVDECYDREATSNLSKNLTLYERDYDLSIDEAYELSKLFLNSPENQIFLINTISSIRTSIHFNLIANADNYFLNAFNNFSIGDTLSRNQPHTNLIETNVLSKFGIPIPINPTPEQLFDYRESNSHSYFKKFIESIHLPSEHEKMDFHIQHAIVDGIQDSFKTKNKRNKNLVYGIAGTVFDIAIAAMGVPLPIGSASNLTKEYIDDTKRHNNFIWRSFFYKWLNENE